MISGEHLISMKAPIFIGLTALALAGLIFSQQPKQPGVVDPNKQAADPSQQDDFTIVGTFNFVMVPVTVETRDGDTVNGLSLKDFRLLDNGKLQNIAEDVTTHPLSVVIVVQTSPNMEKLLPQIQKLSSLLQAQVLGDEGEVAIIGFDGRITKISDFTSNPDRLAADLKKLKLGSSGGRLNDATLEAITLLKTRPKERRRAMILIAESRDNGSELRAREVLSAADFANVVIYSVNVSHLLSTATASIPATRSVLDNRPPGAVFQPGGNIETPTTQSQNNMGNWVPLLNEIYIAAKGLIVKNPLEVYTRYTGGREFSYNTQRELDRAVTNIGNELHSQYLLTYSPNNQDEAGFHNVVVQVLKPDLKIRARDGYYLAGNGKAPVKK